MDDKSVQRSVGRAYDDRLARGSSSFLGSHLSSPAARLRARERRDRRAFSRPRRGAAVACRVRSADRSVGATKTNARGGARRGVGVCGRRRRRARVGRPREPVERKVWRVKRPGHGAHHEDMCVTVFVSSASRPPLRAPRFARAAERRVISLWRRTAYYWGWSLWSGRAAVQEPFPVAGSGSSALDEVHRT